MPMTRSNSGRPRTRYGPLLVSGLLLVGLMIVGKVARAKLAWWRDAAFDGEVVGRSAVSRSTGAPTDDAAALREPAKCRFYLRIGNEQGERTQEIVPTLFRAVRLGDRVAKKAGTYAWECSAAPPNTPSGESEEGAASGRGLRPQPDPKSQAPNPKQSPSPKP